jgi:hypothetical protein
MRNTQRECYIESHINNLPDYFCKRAFDEKVLNRLLLITKTRLNGTLPISFDKVVLSEDFLSLNKPRIIVVPSSRDGARIFFKGGGNDKQQGCWRY